MELTCRIVLLIAAILPVALAEGDKVISVAFNQIIIPSGDTPRGLKARFSPLNESAIRRYGGYLADKSMGIHAREFCDDASLLCDDDVDLISDAKFGDLADVFFPYFLLYRKTYNTANDQTNKSLAFFREKRLLKGGKMALPGLRNPVFHRAFLPLSLASELPFSGVELPELLKTLNISQVSVMAHRMAGTLKDCETESSGGEVKMCVTSAEELVKFAREKLGDNFGILETTGWEGSHETVELMDVHLKASEKDNVIACHDSAFPYTVLYCHKIGSTKVYQTSWEASNGKVVHGVAVCHMDTSDFNAMHPALTALDLKPGEGESCHWMSESNPVCFSLH